MEEGGYQLLWLGQRPYASCRCFSLWGEVWKVILTGFDEFLMHKNGDGSRISLVRYLIRRCMLCSGTELPNYCLVEEGRIS